MLVVVTGTATEVGKTFIAARMAATLRARGQKVAARKPVQSFDPSDTPTDADVLAAATGEDPRTVCPSHRWYPRAMAPPIAALHLGLSSYTIGDLIAETVLPGDGVVLVEGVGGPRSPLATDGDTVELVRGLAPDLVVLVAEPGLGAINSVLLCAAALAPARVVVVLNRFDPGDVIHSSNRDWLIGNARLDVVTDLDELMARLAAPTTVEVL
jgi:dethiobiotin synthetase